MEGGPTYHMAAAPPPRTRPTYSLAVTRGALPGEQAKPISTVLPPNTHLDSSFVNKIGLDNIYSEPLDLCASPLKY